ncbi:unnamed protein product [Rodentolepis nana]|uniref:C2H2-type domain-containing protein n=1 Tax=Rodentolepis nana TaxID=102285 RepID=A0A3P7RQ53_RODNA|nr:unnamed protein product [Rodentolepis nana]
MTNSPVDYFYCLSCNFRSENRNEFEIDFQALHEQNMNSTTSLGMPVCKILFPLLDLNETYDDTFPSKPVIHILFIFLAPLNKFNSILDNDLPTKHGPLDVVDESIAKMSKEITNKEKRLSCDKCKMKFRYPSQLETHKRRHSGEKPFECESCGNQFIRKSELNSHKLVHTDERPHECRKCGKKFKRQSDLSQHMRTHTFKHTHHLTRYLRSHSEERLTSIQNKYNLTVRMRSYTGEKNIQM